MTEIELKFLLDEVGEAALRRAPALRAMAEAPAKRSRLRSIYFDTPDQALRRAKIALRLRKVGRGWVQTVKRGSGAGTGLFAVQEDEAPAPGGRLDFGLIADADLRAAVEDAIGDAPLSPVFETVMERTTRNLAAEGGTAELAIDVGEIVAGGAVDRAIAHLDSLGLLYRGVLEPPKGKAPPEDWEPREQMLFRATDFGDDVDRPLQKGDGSWTYFATDLAYHYDKFTRGFRDMINVWGADHGGYVKRMKAGVSALTEEQANLDVKICQMVNLLDRGEPVRMSKRAGNFVTLRDVVDAVGKDVVRFMMLTRRNDAPLDFDLAKVTEQSRDNPVFYVQYAHARIRSVMRNAEEILGADAVAAALQEAGDLAALTHDAELGLIKLLAAWPRQIESAAESHEPHRLAFYLYDLASAFHGLWNLGKEDPGLRFLIEDDVATTHARLALIEGVRLVIASGLDIFGVEPVEEMR